jgi:hypothetical protein
MLLRCGLWDVSTVSKMCGERGLDGAVVFWATL